MKRLKDIFYYIFAPLVLFLTWVKGVVFFSDAEFEDEIFTIKDCISDCLVVPIWEEAFFRYAPLTIVSALSDKIRQTITLPVVILISVYFAEQHGSALENVLIQGVLSMILSWLIIKRGYMYAVILHALYNFSNYFM